MIKTQQYLVLIVAVLLLLLLNGCATVIQTTDYQQLYMGSGVRSYIQVGGLHQERTGGDLLRVAFDGVSLYEREVKYRFVWLDVNGFELPGLTARWHRYKVYSQQPFQLQAIATDPKVVNYRLLIYDLHAAPVADDTK